MKIVTADPQDALQIAAFARRTFIAAYGGDDPPAAVRQHVGEWLSDDAIERDISDPDSTVLVATCDTDSRNTDRDILGYVTLRWNRPIDELADSQPAKLERIYVDQQRQSGGVGSALIAAAVDAAAKRAAQSVWLSVWKENPRAHAFYERNGFRRVGETVFMMGPNPEEDFIYAKPCPASREGSADR